MEHTSKEIVDMLYGENPITNPVTRSSYFKVLANRTAELEQKVQAQQEQLDSSATKIVELTALCDRQDNLLVGAREDLRAASNIAKEHGEKGSSDAFERTITHIFDCMNSSKHESIRVVLQDEINSIVTDEFFERDMDTKVGNRYVLVEAGKYESLLLKINPPPLMYF